MQTRIPVRMRSGLWPREVPRHTESLAEGKVYRALKASLLKGWYAWHSLRLRSREDGEFGEADFVIADPNLPGMLILEVKGGQIEQRDGRWHQNSLPLELSPLDQAFSFRKVLLGRFNEENVKPPTIGVAVCFPDTFFETQPGQDDLEGLVIGGQDIPYLNKILPDVMIRAVPDPWPVKGPWIKLIHALWGETWVPKPCLGRRIQTQADERARLDREQWERLEEIEENDRMLIRGAAGTGKTLLAVEAALRQAGEGRKVLLVCFTNALGEWLSNTVVHPNVTCAAIRPFAVRLLGDTTPVTPGAEPSDYWNNVSLRAAMDGLPAEEDRWDAVIVDEGQDFSSEDWDLVEECARKTGRLWVFADVAQAFWSDRNIPERIEKGSFKVRLKRPYRCPPEIQNLADAYAGHGEPDTQLLKEGVHQGVIRVVTSSEQKIARQVGKEINRLISEGLAPHDIAVISLRGLGARENIVYAEELGGHKAVPAAHDDAGSQIICDTFLRFKGLERPAVIVTDLRLVSDLYEKRMHIAVSRALSLLRIVGVESEIAKDAILAELI
jgi:hypothetical protein